ncbi:MAG: hypothetical protein WCQ77_05565 [Planctomycetota bacterium]
MKRFTRYLVLWTTLLACLEPSRADELADRLRSLVGQTLDLVELGTGRRLVRPVLEGVGDRQGKTVSLRLRPEGEPKTITVTVANIAKIVAGRETIHAAEAKGTGAAQTGSHRVRERREQQQAESLQRMEASGVEPWPPLTAEEHAEQVAELEAFVAEVQRDFPTLAVSQTHEFLVATNIPTAQMAPFTAKLDAMHDFLCDLYGIPRGEPVWKGKCLVVAFLKEEDFAAFESRFMKVEVAGAHGLCHQRSDGRVVMGCHRGPDPSAFAHMLVHETSHGFNHRWVSPQHLPNWLNEGIAEWVGTQVVPACNQVSRKEAKALEFIKAGGTVGPGFFAVGPDHHIDAVQYGIASGIVKFMVARDRRKFATFVRGIKEGLSVEESLRQSFDASLPELLAAYGRVSGVPGLKE